MNAVKTVEEYIAELEQLDLRELLGENVYNEFRDEQEQYLVSEYADSLCDKSDEELWDGAALEFIRQQHIEQLAAGYENKHNL